jgi:hypothetical protein
MSVAEIKARLAARQAEARRLRSDDAGVVEPVHGTQTAPPAPPALERLDRRNASTNRGELSQR